jgi:hypothetical protein
VQALNTAFTTNGVTDTVSGASGCSPIAVVKSSADPHVTNILGQRFDIFSTGMVTLIQAPRGHGHAQSVLTVDARVDKIGNGPWQTYATRSRQLQDSLTTAGDISYEFKCQHQVRRPPMS